MVKKIVCSLTPQAKVLIVLLKFFAGAAMGFLIWFSWYFWVRLHPQVTFYDSLHLDVMLPLMGIGGLLSVLFWGTELGRWTASRFGTGDQPVDWAKKEREKQLKKERKERRIDLDE